MPSIPPPHVDIASLLDKLETNEVVQYSRATQGKVNKIAETAFAALESPWEFPPLSAAIVPGDRVALAIDPNVPEVIEVLRGVLKALAKIETGGIEIVLWDEATDQTVAAIQREVGEAIHVVRH